MELLETVTRKALQGQPATVGEALEIGRNYPLDEILEAADRIRRERVGDEMDTCSIVNARSGRCSEDCKWCAQSCHFHTGAQEYDMVPHDELQDSVQEAVNRGIKRLSLVCSGRKVGGAALKRFCEQYREIHSKTSLKLCASMGLLNLEELKQLREAGVERYHCNLETSRDFFPTLCTTHTYDQKIATLQAARQAGMEVCSGGIIGMGESMEQRLRLAETAREQGIVSMPINVLHPIPGTPLGHLELISEEEIVLSIALMKFIAPDVALRLTGGRARLSEQGLQNCLKAGISGALVGDLLTTVGNSIDDDCDAFAKAGRKSSLKKKQS